MITECVGLKRTGKRVLAKNIFSPPQRISSLDTASLNSARVAHLWSDVPDARSLEARGASRYNLGVSDSRGLLARGSQMHAEKVLVPRDYVIYYLVSIAYDPASARSLSELYQIVTVT